MMVAALIAYAASALFFFGAGLMLFASYDHVEKNHSEERRDKTAGLFWFSLIASFALAVVGGLLW